MFHQCIVFHYQMSYINSNVCPYCRRLERCDFTLDCGQRVHLKCFGEILKGDDTKYRFYINDYKCWYCKRNINNLSAYWDIFCNARMNESENFYLKISGTSVMGGLAKYLLDNEEYPLERFLERTYLMHENFNFMFSTDREICQYALVTGERRVIKYIKHRYHRLKMALPDDLFDDAWNNDWMEMLNDLSELDVYRQTYNVDKVPIMLAAKMGDYELMNRLIASEANIVLSRKGVSPLAHACMSNEFENTDEKIKFIDKYWGKIMRTKIYNFIEEKDSPFIYAFEKNDKKLLEYLLYKGLKPTEYSIDYVILNGNLDLIKTVHLSSRSGFKSSHLDQVCEKKSDEIFEYLLTDRNLGSECKTAKLYNLITQNNLHLAELFLKCNIEPDRYLFVKTLRDGFFEMAKLLIEYDVERPNVNYFSEFNFETIRNSSEERITEIIAYFLYLGFEINSTDSTGRTLLSRLCENDLNWQ